MTTTVSAMTFESVAQSLKGKLIARLPESASKQLPSRGQVAVTGAVNGNDLQAVIEPDGRGGHWLRLDAILGAVIHAGDAVTVEMIPAKQWPEPVVPDDLAAALAHADESVRAKWRDITPMARWEWVRWVGATANSTTRATRIAKTISKLAGTHRRPCCFNLAACTDPALSRSGRLIEE